MPVKQGGSLVKPQWDGPAGELPKEPRNDFQVCQAAGQQRVARSTARGTLPLLHVPYACPLGFLAPASPSHPHPCHPHATPPCHHTRRRQIFFQERFDDVLAASPALFAHGMADRRDLLAAASVYWRETLTEEERAAYRERAAEEKKAHAAALAEASRGGGGCRGGSALGDASRNRSP